MTLDKAIELQWKAESTVVSIFHDATKNHHTHAQILDTLKERLAHIHAHKLPRWLSSVIYAYQSALFKSLYYDKLVWMHSFEGTLYADFGSLPEAGKEAGRKGTLVSNHYWVGTTIAY